MSHWSAFLQVSGGVSELIGLAFVAAGISSTRSRFSHQPFILHRAWAALGRFGRRFYRRRHPPVQLSGSAHLSGGLSLRARGRVSLGAWDDVDLEERLERVKRHLTRHEEELDRLHDEAERDTDARKKADEAERQLRERLREELRQLIEDAAAGGLRLESWGVTFFVLGITLQTWGNLVS